MKTEDLAADLAASRTDLARYLEAAARSDRPYVVVTADAVKAWEKREPQTWAKFSDWLAANGKTVVQI